MAGLAPVLVADKYIVTASPLGFRSWWKLYHFPYFAGSQPLILITCDPPGNDESIELIESGKVHLGLEKLKLIKGNLSAVIHGLDPEETDC